MAGPLLLLCVASPLHSLVEGAFGLRVINPDPSLTGECNAILVYEIEDGGNSGDSGSDRCSAVAIGPQALMTAAHCLPPVGGDETVRIKVWYGSSPRTGECVVHPAFRTDAWEDPTKIPFDSADLALCAFSAPFPHAWVRTVEVDPGVVYKDREVILAGHGCTELESCSSDLGGDWFGCGRAMVESTPESAHHLFLIQAGDDGSALCKGDSGGPVYVDEKVVGIGQAGCVTQHLGRSAAAWLANRATVRWMCDWQASDKGSAIRDLVCP